MHRGTVALRSGESAAFLMPRFDPIDRALVVVNAGPALEPHVRWRLRVAGVRDLDGHELAEPWEIAFRTGPDAIGEPDPPPPDFAAEILPLLLARCAGAGCHGADGPALGLDLSSAEGVRATAIGVPAEQARVGTQGDRPWGTATLAGLARIDAGRPAFSYLVYKLTGDPHVEGDRMPPSDRPPLSPGEVRALSRWILAGAPTD